MNGNIEENNSEKYTVYDWPENINKFIHTIKTTHFEFYWKVNKLYLFSYKRQKIFENLTECLAVVLGILSTIKLIYNNETFLNITTIIQTIGNYIIAIILYQFKRLQVNEKIAKYEIAFKQHFSFYNELRAVLTSKTQDPYVYLYHSLRRSENIFNEHNIIVPDNIDKLWIEYRDKHHLNVITPESQTPRLNEDVKRVVTQSRINLHVNPINNARKELNRLNKFIEMFDMQKNQNVN